MSTFSRLGQTAYILCRKMRLSHSIMLWVFDERHAPSLCLMGRLQMEILKNFKTAKHYFECALLADSDYVETYKYYSLLLIWLGDLTNAERILKMGENKPGFSKLVAITRRASILENSGKVKEAILLLKTGKNLSNCTKTFDFLKMNWSGWKGK